MNAAETRPTQLCEFHGSRMRAVLSRCCTHTERHRMESTKEFEDKLWKALKSDRTLMLGLDGVEDGHARPMTAQVEGDQGPIWFFTARDHALVQKLERGDRAIA